MFVALRLLVRLCGDAYVLLCRCCAVARCLVPLVHVLRSHVVMRYDKTCFVMSCLIHDFGVFSLWVWRFCRARDALFVMVLCGAVFVGRR